MKPQTFFYRAYIMRQDRKVCREGTLQEKYPLDALDRLVVMSTEVWKKPLIKIELYEMSRNGELVATSTTGDRINAVLATNAQLNPDKYKDMAERRKVAIKAAQPEKKEIGHKPAVAKPTPLGIVEDTVHNWQMRHCTRYITQSFVTLKKVTEY